MANKPPTDSQSGKDAEGSAPDQSGLSPMERFKSLTKGLLAVKPESLNIERQIYKDQKEKKNRS
jgi:hypothetical protein